MTICEGDPMMADFLMNGPVSMYLTKLEYWVESHRKAANASAPAAPNNFKHTVRK